MSGVGGKQKEDGIVTKLVCFGVSIKEGDRGGIMAGLAS